MITMQQLSSHEEWLQARSRYIGGSDAASILGRNPYKDNVTLWLEKTGRKEPEDLSGKPYIQYGHRAEPLLRELFQLDFPEYRVEYAEHNLWLNDKYPWAHASLDGWLTDPDGRKGVLEIKTTEILRSMQKEQWKEQIPDNYYIQVLHYLMVTEFDFAILKAQLKYSFDEDVFLQTRHYQIQRTEVAGDINCLKQAEQNFAEQIKRGRQPDLILPQI